MQKTKSIYKKLKAGALQYTIFIAVVIALLIFAFISLTFTQQHFKAKASNYLQTIHHANLGVHHTLTEQIVYDKPVEVQLSEQSEATTTIEKKHWGIFDRLTTTASIKKETFIKNSLLGGFLTMRPALYLQNNNQPLVVVGDTRIEGKVFLPKQGAKRGTIAGNSYAGSQLIYGSTEISRTALPQVKNRKYIKQLTQGNLSSESAASLELVEHVTLINSFTNPTQLFYSSTAIDLRLVKLTGNISIRSSSKIRVYASAELTDVLLIAPKIEILDKVEGNFQAFATKNITLGKNCKLNYPSALVLYEKDKKVISNQPNNQDKEIDQIMIDSGSEIRGIVAYLSDNKMNTFKPQIVLEDDTYITGEVFCNQNIELKGTVKGSVYTKQFIANQFGSIYQNHIYNGKILSKNFPKQYCGLAFEKNSTKVVKWLY